MAETVAVADVPQPEKITAPPSPSSIRNPETDKNPTMEEAVAVAQSVGFKEESTLLTHLLDSEKKALQQLRTIVQEALKNRAFSNAKRPPSPAEENKNLTEAEEGKSSEETKAITEETAAVDDDGAKTVEAIQETIVAVSSKAEDVKTAEEQVSIWGIPLLADERSDVILLKFLRARDLRVRDAFTMLKKTIQWREEFGVDGLLESEDLGIDLGKAVFMYGNDKQGHPVCYNVYGEFQDKKLYNECFSDDEKRNRFLRCRIQMVEKSIRKLDFNHGGISTIVHVNDLKNSPGPSKKELRQATNQALQLFQDNYPEFVAKQVFINVPWWYLAVNRMISPFLTQRTRSKFVFAAPSRSAETLLRYIGGEQLPVKYGGLSKDGEFETTDTVTQITVKPAAKHSVEFPVSEKSCEVKWQVRVIGWEVEYGAEFVPNAQGSYTVIIQKTRKIGSNANEDEQVLNSSFKIGEPGKLVLTIHNPTSNNKKLLYRFKTNHISSF